LTWASVRRFSQRVSALRERAKSSRHPVLRTWTVLAQVLQGARARNLNVLAAGIGLYAFLALLPFTASVAVIYGMFAEPEAVRSGIRSLLFMAPTRSQELVADRLADIVRGWSGGPQALVIGLLLATYAAARAARSILAALNLIHGYDRRGFVKRWAASLAICLAGGLVTLLALLAIASSSYLDDLIPGRQEGWFLSQVAFWAALATTVSILLALLYRYAPNGPLEPWRGVIPGAVAASTLWLAGSVAFTAYVPVFARYDAIYGSLAAVVVLQLWLYASAFVLLLGAQLNVELEARFSASAYSSCSP
jgi:membrane protein